MTTFIKIAEAAWRWVKRRFWRDPNQRRSPECTVAYVEGSTAWKFGTRKDNMYPKKSPQHRAFKEGYDDAERQEMMVW